MFDQDKGQTDLTVSLAEIDTLFMGFEVCLIQQIYHYIDKKGMTKKDLSNITGISQRMITYYLSGDSKDSLEKLLFICSKLGFVGEMVLKVSEPED